MLNAYQPQPPKDAWDNINSQLESGHGKRIDTKISSYNKHPGSGYWDDINKRLIWNRFITFSRDRFNIYYLIGILFAISLAGTQAIQTKNKRLYHPQNVTDNLRLPLNTQNIFHENENGNNHAFGKKQPLQNKSQAYHKNPSKKNYEPGIQSNDNIPVSISREVSDPVKTAGHNPDNTTYNHSEPATNNQKFPPAGTSPVGKRQTGSVIKTGYVRHSRTEAGKSINTQLTNITSLRKIPLSELIAKTAKSGYSHHYFPDSLINLPDLPASGGKSNLSISIDYGSLLHINTWESLADPEIMIQNMPIHQYFNNNMKSKISHEINVNIIYSKDNFVAATGAGIDILQSQFKGTIPIAHTINQNTVYTYRNVDFDNRVFYLNIPVWIGYREYTPLTEYHMQAGFTGSFPLKSYYTWYDPATNGFIYNDEAPLRKKLFSIAAKGYFARRLNEHCLLGLEPAYYYRLTSVFEEDSGLNSRQHMFKLGLKFQYNL